MGECLRWKGDKDRRASRQGAVGGTGAQDAGVGGGAGLDDSTWATGFTRVLWCGGKGSSFGTGKSQVHILSLAFQGAP